MIKEGGPIIWKTKVSVTVRKRVHMNMCLILNGYQNINVLIYKEKCECL